MAALQSIRNKGGILVSTVIGIALVAFIVDPSILGNPSPSRNKVGEIAGKSIDVQEYQQLVTQNENMIKLMNGLNNLTEDQQRMVRENTWQQKVTEIVMGQEYEALGLGLSEDEMYDLLLGENMNPTIKQMFTNQETGEIDKNKAREIVQNILNGGFGAEQKAIWLNMEQQISTARLLSKYNHLLAKGLYIPDALVQDRISTKSMDISFIVKNYNTISDSTIKVSTSEIKDYYHAHEPLFQQTAESRQIVYVNFDITASSEDIKETEEWVSSLKEEFATAPNILEYANLSSEKKFEPQYYKKGELDPELDQFAFSNGDTTVYGPYLKDNAYHIARVADKKMLPDSIRIRQIVIAANGNSKIKQLADSVAEAIRNGANFETMARKYSVAENAVNGGDLGWVKMTDLPKPLNEMLFSANKGFVEVLPLQNGQAYNIIQVSDRGALVEKVQLGIIAKEITASQQTINKIYNDARTFANNLETLDDFNAAVTAQKQQRRIAYLGKNDKTIPGIDNARELIRQAYLAEKPGYVLMTNDKSPIFENGEKFTIAVLTSIKKEGLAPLKGEVANNITRELIRKKKGEIIAKDLEKAIASSESLLSVAQKVQAEVVDASEISFTSFQIPGGGIEPKVIAETVILDEGKISKPIIGNQGVYVVVVNTKNTITTTPEQLAELKKGLSQTTLYRINYQTVPSLVKKAGVVDTRYKFY